MGTAHKNRIILQSYAKNSAYNLMNRLNIKVLDLNPIYFNNEGVSNITVRKGEYGPQEIKEYLKKNKNDLK